MVDTGKTRLHSIESRSALECSSPAARSRSCAYSSKKPGPPEGGVPARYVEGSESKGGRVIPAYPSEARSPHFSGAIVGQPMSTWKPAISLPKRKAFGGPRAQGQRQRRRGGCFNRPC